MSDAATPATGESGAMPVAAPTAPAPEPVQTPDVSILAELRAKRAKIGAGSDPLDLDVPGYDGLLVVRYKWTPFEEVTRTAPQLAKIGKPTAHLVAAAADTLIAACEEVLIRVEDALRPLAADGDPIRFGDPRLAEALGFTQPETVRQSVMLVFKNEYALINQSEAVMNWLQGITTQVNEDYLGE